MGAFGGCLKYRPQWPEAQANLALAYSGLGDRSQAERIDEKMLEADLKSADALRGRAAIAIQTSDLDAGLKLHVRLIGLGERSAEVLYNAGAHVRKSGPARQSFEVLSESPRRKPDTPEALLNPGRILEAPENRQKPEPAGLVAWKRNRIASSIAAALAPGAPRSPYSPPAPETTSRTARRG